MKVIDYIRQKVKECGSQSAVARKCGISQALVNKMMYDYYDVQVGTIYKIAAAYGINPAVFIQSEIPLVSEHPESYQILSDDEQAILEMIKGDPGLARQVRRFTQFEKQADTEDLKIDTTKAA